MITKKDLTKFLQKYPDCKLMIHNGYHSWSYGCPKDPLYINIDSAVQLINIIAKQKNIKPLNMIDNDSMHHLSYADIGDKLYNLTMNNRIIGIYEPVICKFEKLDINQTEINLDLSALL